MEYVVHTNWDLQNAGSSKVVVQTHSHRQTTLLGPQATKASEK